MHFQIKFFEVSEEELEVQRAAFAAGQLQLETQEQSFDMAAYNRFVADVAREAAAFREKQQAASAQQVRAFNQLQTECTPAAPQVRDRCGAGRR